MVNLDPEVENCSSVYDAYKNNNNLDRNDTETSNRVRGDQVANTIFQVFLMLHKITFLTLK